MVAKHKFTAFLKTIPFFKALPDHDIQILSDQFEEVYLQSGQVLIQQGEKGDSLYLVISGRLRAFVKSDEGKEIIVGEIGRGELIGELALLTGEVRAATVTAIRDSVLLKLSQSSFETFITNNPLHMMPIVKTTLLRILKSKKQVHNTVTTIAIVPAGDNQSTKEFTQSFTKELSSVSPTLYLNRDIMQEFLKKNHISLDKDDEELYPILIEWLNQQEQDYRYVVYETDVAFTPWTKRSLRQADKILLIAHENQNDALNAIEKDIFVESDYTRKNVDLVLIHKPDTLYPTNTTHWMKHRKLNQLHHIKNHVTADLQRIIRIITGRSIALVLNGAGARGLAHLGVYQALTELKIPIDLLAGVSFGALTASAIAMGLQPSEMKEVFRTTIVENKKLFYYTIPLLSINAGKQLTDGLKKGFGEMTHIEDLWKQFFCISSNLSRGEIEIIQSGLLWKAIRASVSLPAIFPPITNEHNELLIDGGIMNNFPVDIMRHRTNGGKIIGARVSTVSIPTAQIPEGVLSGWRLLFQLLLKKTGPRFPNIADIIVKTIGLSSLAHENKMLLEADCFINVEAKDYSLFDFKKMEELIEIGYRATMNKADILTKL